MSFNDIVKEHRRESTQRRRNLDKVKVAAATAVENVTTTVLTDVTKRRLDAEAKALQAQSAAFARQAQKWVGMYDELNDALKELGDVVNWSQMSEKCQIIMVCGDQSGVGKTSFSMGLLCSALRHGFPPSSLAYIKPCTQCEDTQLLWKWCESEGIAHEGVGPILYRAGYTQEVIDGKHGTAEERLDKVFSAVNKLASAPGRRLVVVDGVGYPGVGSCTGTSNGSVARRIGARVVLVGRPGVGNAIDSAVMAREYFARFSVPILGGVFNKIPRKVSYHTYDKCKEYVSRFFADEAAALAAGGPFASAAAGGAVAPFSVYGFVPVVKDKEGNEDDGGGACSISCALRKPSKASLAMTEEDVDRAVRTCQTMIDNVDFTLLFSDLAKEFGVSAPPAPAAPAAFVAPVEDAEASVATN